MQRAHAKRKKNIRSIFSGKASCHHACISDMRRKCCHDKKQCWIIAVCSFTFPLLRKIHPEKVTVRELHNAVRRQRSMKPYDERERKQFHLKNTYASPIVVFSSCVRAAVPTMTHAHARVRSQVNASSFPMNTCIQAHHYALPKGEGEICKASAVNRSVGNTKPADG